MLDAGWRFRFGWCGLAFAIGLSALGAVDDAGAQQRVAGSRVVVTGEGSISVAPDVVQIRSGVSTRGKTVREAAETNSKTMAAILTALTESGIPQKDVRTAQLSIQPVYAAQEPGKEQKLVGYSVANHVSAKIKHVEKLGDALGRVVSIEEESGASSPMPMRALAQPAPGAHVPIAPGENTLRAVVSVAFEIAR